LENEQNAAIFVKTVSRLMVVATACFITSALAVHFAAKPQFTGELRLRSHVSPIDCCS
jgi:hypothetical protein